MHRGTSRAVRSSALQASSILVYLFIFLSIAHAGPLDEWTSRTSGTTSDLYNVAWGGGRFVAVGSAGSLLTSSDGATWRASSSPTTVWLYGVAYGNGVFVAAGQAGTIIVSSDGSSWSRVNSPVSNMLYCVVYGGGRFIIVGTGGTILTSTDGSSWTRVASGVTLGLFGVAHGNNRFVIVGESGVVLTSTDGLSWARRTSNSSKWFDQVSYGNNRFVAAGEGGAIITSSDGISWNQRSSGTTTTDFYCIGFGNGTFAAVGSQGSIFTSSDGVTWTTRSSGTATFLRGIAFDGRRFVATGGRGTILQSGAVAGPPIADAGENQTAEVGALVTLDGSGSHDPLNEALVYRWFLDVAPAGSAAILSDSTSVSPSFIPDVAGEYSVRLVVTNASGDPSDPSWTVIIAGTLPVAEAGPDQSGISTGALVALDGSASTAPDGNIPLKFEWEIMAGPSNSTAVLTGRYSANANMVPDVRGVYIARLTVVNSIGLQSEPDTATITVGLPPVADPGPSRKVDAGTRVTLDGGGSVSTDNALPLTFVWEFKSRPGGSTASLENSTTVQPSFTADVPGDFTVGLTVMDPAGFQSKQVDVTITSVYPATDVEGGAGGNEGGGGGGSCFIATAAFGSYLAPQVVLLRQFRDEHLLDNRPGRWLVRTYYSVSPSIAGHVKRSRTLAFIVRLFLTPFVCMLAFPLPSAGLFAVCLGLLWKARRSWKKRRK